MLGWLNLVLGVALAVFVVERTVFQNQPFQPWPLLAGTALAAALATCGYGIIDRKTWTPVAAIVTGCVWVLSTGTLLALHYAEEKTLELQPSLVFLGSVAYSALYVLLCTHPSARRDYFTRSSRS